MEHFFGPLADLVTNPWFWGYTIFSAAVGALESPTEKNGQFYRWAFKFLNTLAANVTRAFSSKLNGNEKKEGEGK
jgi:hypothetical protein